MKILKHGKIEQKKFVCKKCECEFVASFGDTEWWGDRVLYCPICGVKIWWSDGEPYEEPAPTQTDETDDLNKLRELIHEWRADSTNLLPLAEHLLREGVTFRG